jgi:hypothetical protein
MKLGAGKSQSQREECGSVPNLNDTLIFHGSWVDHFSSLTQFSQLQNGYILSCNESSMHKLFIFVLKVFSMVSLPNKYHETTHSIHIYEVTIFSFVFIFFIYRFIVLLPKAKSMLCTPHISSSWHTAKQCILITLTVTLRSCDRTLVNRDGWKFHMWLHSPVIKGPRDSLSISLPFVEPVVVTCWDDDNTNFGRSLEAGSWNDLLEESHQIVVWPTSALLMQEVSMCCVQPLRGGGPHVDQHSLAQPDYSILHVFKWVLSTH